PLPLLHLLILLFLILLLLSGLLLLFLLLFGLGLALFYDLLAAASRACGVVLSTVNFQGKRPGGGGGRAGNHGSSH
ncbi:hypothetical protein V8F06_011084, partial [Rhypophila decipiens]